MNESPSDPHAAPGSLSELSSNKELKYQGVILGSMYTGYAYFMILRSAPAAVSPALTNELGLSVEQWGTIVGMSTIGAVIGKLVVALGVDRLGGRITFALGLILCGLGIAAFGQANSVRMLQATFFLALMAKSAGWPAMTCIVKDTFRPAQFGRVWGIMGTSSRAGTLLATLCLGALIAVAPWQTVLVVTGLGGIIIAVGFAVADAWAAKRLSGLRLDDQEQLDLRQTLTTDQSASNNSLSAFENSIPGTLMRCVVSRQFWLITISLTGMTIMWDFLQFVPVYLNRALNLSESASSVTSTAFPAGSFVAVLFGGFIYDAVSQRKTAVVMGSLLLVATACIGVFPILQVADLSQSKIIAVVLVTLFIFGACIAPCYYIPMSVYSIRAGGLRAGFLVSLLDGIAFGINAVFQFRAGRVADSSWNQFFLLLGGIALISAVTMYIFLLGEAQQEDSSGMAPAV